MIRSLLHRLRAARRSGRTVRMWYHPDYAAAGLGATHRVRDISVRRSEQVLAALKAEGVLMPSGIRAPEAVAYAALSRIHSTSYLHNTDLPETLANVFALDPAQVQTESLLQAARLAVGGTLAAASWAARGPARVGFNLGGGFHHARADHGTGFCLYNDVAVAIADLRAAGYGSPIAVVDLDYHEGDATRALFADDTSVLTYSLHGSVWSHSEALTDVQHHLPPGTTDAQYYRALAASLPDALSAHGPDLVFYLAGNDVLAGDRLGDFELSEAGVFKRDRYVLQCIREVGASGIITLAGGYSDDAWRCTANLLRWLLTDDATLSPKAPRDLGAHFEAIARELDPLQLQVDDPDDWELDPEDILPGLPAARPRTERLLGYYSRHGIEYALEHYGLCDALRLRGFRDFELDVDTTDPQHQVLRLQARHAHRGKNAETLVEVVLKRHHLPMPEWGGQHGATPADFEVLSVDWLLLQDPTRHFTLDRPPLPGQKHPGLGLARQVLEVLIQVCNRLELDGIVEHPAHYHSAASAHPRFRFWDPATQGVWRALGEAVEGLAIADASRAVTEGRVRCQDGQTVNWRAEPLVLPITPRLAAVFESEAYQRAAAYSYQRLHEAGIHVEATDHREIGSAVSDNTKFD